MCTFSILIPAYKRRYLGECLASCLSQTYQDYEIVVVDDASPEDLKSVVDGFQGSRIRYYRNEKNCGALNVVDNWNICLSHSEGDYVICMGDDDRLLPNCLDEYRKLIDKYPGIGLLHGWTEIIDENSQPILPTTHRCEHESAMSLMWHRSKAYGRQYVGDFCYKRDYLLENGGFYKLPLAWGSNDISAFIAAKKCGVANTQTAVFQYRFNAANITSTGSVPVKIEAINQKYEWKKRFLSSPCDDRMDELYRRELIKILRDVTEREKRFEIGEELRHQSVWRPLFWLWNRKKYDLRYQTIFHAIVRACRSRN